MTRTLPWQKPDPVKNYYPVPKVICQLGLSPGEIAVYSFLLFCEDRKTYQCYPSYRTIGDAVGMSRNTVCKYVRSLEEKGLIRTERTTVTLKDGRKRNGSLLYTLLPVDEDGSVSPEALEAAIQPDTCLISVMLANNEVGTLEPVEALCRLAHAHDILFHTDAVQAAGHIPVDAEKLGVDYMTVAAHKFHGPKGMGALYIRKGAPLHPFITGGEQERDLRAGTHNVPGAVGMACAMEEAVKNMEEDVPRITALRDKLIEGILAAVPDARLNGPRQNRLPQNVSFGLPGPPCLQP